MTNTPLTPENFERLLLYLDPDREKAGELHELLWQKMREFFAARGSLCTEDLADEAMSRLAKKISEGEEILDVNKYSFGLARLIWLESLRRPENKHVSFDEAPVLLSGASDFLLTKEENTCFVYCLGQISKEEQTLITEYWDHDEEMHYEARKQQAEKLGISSTALRIRISRIKKKLDDCLENCRKNGPQKTK